MGLGSVNGLSQICPDVRDVGMTVLGFGCSIFKGLREISRILGLFITSRLLKLGLRRSGGLDRSRFCKYGLLDRSLKFGDPYGLRKTLAWSEMEALDRANELIELFEPNSDICDGLLFPIELMEPRSDICDGLLLLINPKLEESTSFEFLFANDTLEPFKTSESSGGDMDELLRLDSLVGEPGDVTTTGPGCGLLPGTPGRGLEYGGGWGGAALVAPEAGVERP